MVPSGFILDAAEFVELLKPLENTNRKLVITTARRSFGEAIITKVKKRMARGVEVGRPYRLIVGGRERRES